MATYNIPAARTFLLGISFLAIGLLWWLHYMYVRWPRSQNLGDWPCVECTIKKVDVGNTVERTIEDKNYVSSRINVFFEYEFNGKTYTDNQHVSNHGQKSSKYFAYYQPGKKLKCYVNANNFKEAKLHKKMTGRDRRDSLITPASCGSLGLCLIIYGIIRFKTDT